MTHLSTDERNIIHNMLQQGKTKSEIAAAIQRHPTTVWRECRRNRLADGDYSAAFAERYAEQRKNSKARRSAMSPDFITLMEQGLANHHSPEQIIGRLKAEGESKVPCVQTLYNHIRREKKKGRNLHKKLRHKGKKRKPHGQGKQRRASLPGRRDIEERPAIVQERCRFGDLECDLIIGANQSGVIVTVNDRATGLAWMAKIKDKQASTVRAALIELLAPLRGKIHTITSDTGRGRATRTQSRYTKWSVKNWAANGSLPSRITVGSADPTRTSTA
jgi:transposase, IS30 family